jgi:hypothetical protein
MASGLNNNTMMLIPENCCEMTMMAEATDALRMRGIENNSHTLVANDLPSNATSSAMSIQ